MKYMPVNLEVDAFKIMPDSKDVNNWPKWLKDLNDFEDVNFLLQHGVFCIQRPGCNLEIVQNGHWLVKQGCLISVVPDYKFCLLYKEMV